MNGSGGLGICSWIRQNSALGGADVLNFGESSYKTAIRRDSNPAGLLGGGEGKSDTPIRFLYDTLV